MQIGSEAHKRAFCRQFIDSHQRFDPEHLPWPELDDGALERIRAVPFWQEVLHTERRAGAIVAAYAAATIADPLVREAVELQGVEEERHAQLLGVMIRHYGLAAEESEIEPCGPDRYTAFADFGYGECLDSFLGFGVFKIARQAGFLPEPLFRIVAGKGARTRCTVVARRSLRVLLRPGDRSPGRDDPARPKGE
jgi:hypothetical protein